MISLVGKTEGHWTTLGGYSPSGFCAQGSTVSVVLSTRHQRHRLCLPSHRTSLVELSFVIYVCRLARSYLVHLQIMVSASIQPRPCQAVFLLMTPQDSGIQGNTDICNEEELTRIISRGYDSVHSTTFSLCMYHARHTHHGQLRSLD